ncbi:MAG: LPS export ABC transporter permease LptG [Steroidobacteraceae bacterium]
MTVLERYIANTAARALVVVSGGLTALFSLLELVNQLHDVGKGTYRLIDAILYVLLTAPARVLQLMPVSMLVASLFALGALASRNELAIMRATGMSLGRIVGSVFRLAAVVVVLLFLAAQFVIPAAEQRAQTLRVSRISAASVPRRTQNSFWAEGDNEYLNVRKFASGNVPQDIDVYTFASGGALARSIHAASADVHGDGTWLLHDVIQKRFDASGVETEHLDSLPWRSFLRPQQVGLLILPPRSMQPIGLYRYVGDLKRRHEPTARYAQELWAKIDIPIAMVAMILIAVPFVLGPLRTHGTGHRIVVGALIGIVFTLVQQIASYLGELSNVHPAITATAPSLLTIAIALYLFPRAPA